MRRKTTAKRHEATSRRHNMSKKRHKVTTTKTHKWTAKRYKIMWWKKEVAMLWWGVFVTRGPLFDNQSMAVRGDGKIIFYKLKSWVSSSSQVETRQLFANMNSEGDYFTCSVVFTAFQTRQGLISSKMRRKHSGFGCWIVLKFGADHRQFTSSRSSTQALHSEPGPF